MSSTFDWKVAVASTKSRNSSSFFYAVFLDLSHSSLHNCPHETCPVAPYGWLKATKAMMEWAWAITVLLSPPLLFPKIDTDTLAAKGHCSHLISHIHHTLHLIAERKLYKVLHMSSWRSACVGVGRVSCVTYLEFTFFSDRGESLYIILCSEFFCQFKSHTDFNF